MGAICETVDDIAERYVGVCGHQSVVECGEVTATREEKDEMVFWVTGSNGSWSYDTREGVGYVCCVLEDEGT